MKLSELASYAEKKYHITEEHKWTEFPGFSVLADPDTGKWAALLMRQWDYEAGTELQRCDIKCGKQSLEEYKAPYLTNAFRMKGPKWVGVQFDDRTDPEVVFRLFDRAIHSGEQRGYQIVLESRRADGANADTNCAVYRGNKTYSDTLLPLEPLRGNYQRRVSSSPASSVPPRILEMMQLYEHGGNTYENKCRNFYRQGKFMEDYEDNASWSGEFKRYFTTYHDLNLNLLRGYFAWRTLVRRGEFHRITTSLAYMYVYELLNGIGTVSPEDSLRKMKEFEAGYLDSGIGDPSMRENLRRWEMEFAVLSGAAAEEVLHYLDPSVLERDRQLLILRCPQNFSDEEVYSALNALSEGKTENTPVLAKDPERGKHLFAEVWRYMAEHYADDGWDIFTACFGKLREFAWHPLANAVYYDRSGQKEREYVVNACRKYICRDGFWFEMRYDNLYFDKYRIHSVMHEADRQLRRYFKTGRYLRAKQGEDWITPYVESVIELDKEAVKEAAKPKIVIDLSGLDKIRRDAQITRDSLLIEEEMPEQSLASEPGLINGPAQITGPVANSEPASTDRTVETAHTGDENAAAEILPWLDALHGRILLSVMRGEPVEELISGNHLLPSVVTDAINEAFFDEIGDSVLECEGDQITLVEDYREDLVLLLGGDNT